MNLININEEIAEADEADMVIIRNPKIYLERVNPFEIYDENNFKNRYRMSKQVVQFVIDLVQEQLAPVPSNRGGAISVSLQVLATIRYLAKGAYGQDIGDQHGISQPALSLIVKRVVEAIAAHRERFIKFPEGDEVNQIKEEFYNIGQCPSIIGAIDGTHVKIKCPGGDYPLLYLNRKGYYSLNIQVVSDAKCKIRDIVARWRGSIHDSRIWNNCELKRKFERGEIRGTLLGDNGYACSRYVLTPLLNPITPAEQSYNRSHIKTRNVVERLFGYWKNKFRCFYNGLQMNLDTTKAAIIALAVLHNICIEHADSSDDEDNANYEDNDNENIAEINIPGNVFRRQYIERHFN